MRLSYKEMKLETNAIAVRVLAEVLALKCCMTSSPFINRLFVHSVQTACGFVCSENESDEVQYARGVSNASRAIFTWEHMTNYVCHREQFVDNCEPQNEFQNETHCAKVFKMFFYDELIELVVRETNTYA
jgi:hypothetical protein